MSRKKPRALHPEESELWQKVARSARPLNERKKPGHPEFETEAKSLAPPTEVFRPTPFRIGSRATSAPAPATSATPVSRPSPRMDHGTYRKLKQGRFRPEARIDLHGMTADAAHSALTGFIFRAHASGKRLLLVITGKGRGGLDDDPFPSRPGVLRRSLPDWLSRPPLNSVVQEWTEAHLRHGGSGAFYVYLRRPR